LLQECQGAVRYFENSGSKFDFKLDYVKDDINQLNKSSNKELIQQSSDQALDSLN
jgi:hypothetical protein